MKKTRKNEDKAPRRGRSRRLRQLVTGLVCLALMISMASFMPMSSASAYTSLQHIESIVQNLRATSDSFVILEIVPEAGSGSIGYYLNGCEPSAVWKTEVAGIETPSARRTHANNIFKKLQDAGLLSTTDNTPLRIPGGGYDYKETYPWQSASGNKLILNDPERVENVSGTFTKADGPYRSLWEYSLIDTNGDGVGDDGGQHNQKILYFTAVESSEENWDYYYHPSFVPLNDPDSEDLPELLDGTAVYRDAEGTEPAGTYVYVGTMGQDLSLDMTKRYYVVSATGAPHKSRTGYAAVSYEYEDAPTAGPGYFSRDLTGYEYVGATNGDYTFTPGGTSPTSAAIITDTVYYTGGYENNNWFLRHTFDRDTTLPSDLSSMSFYVNSVTPGKVDRDMVNVADMIVLSAGLDIANPSRDLTAALDKDSNDLYASTAKTIYNAASDLKHIPLIVDYRLTEKPGAAGTNLGNLSRLLIAHSLDGSLNNTTLELSDLMQTVTWSEDYLASLATADTDKNFVRKNVFCYNPIDAMPALATPKYNTTLSVADAKGFEAVSSEISYENFLRDQAGISDKLLEGTPTSVRLSNILRYIINYGGQRVVTKKTAISVLEIQPGRGKTLTPETVWGWIGGAGSGVSLNNIKITAMSTSELIGKIEDLIENYDMIYIGSDTTGLNTNSSGVTQYNDSGMEGLLYTNVGDTFRTKNNLMAGLLDRDYYQNPKGSFPTWGSGSGNWYMDMTSSSAANLFRLSGNDLTPSKARELIDFSSAGYPIIYDNSLVQAGTPSVTNINFSVSVSAPATITGNTFNLTAAVSISADVPYTIQWYRDTQHRSQVRDLINGATGAVQSVTADTTERYYYCVVTAGGQTARSNSIRVLRNSSDTLAYAENPSSGQNGTSRYSRSSNWRYVYYSATLEYSGRKLQAIPKIDSWTDSNYILETSNSWTYQWYKGTSQLSGQTGSSYTLPNNNNTAVGQYYCRVGLKEVKRSSNSNGNNSTTYSTTIDPYAHTKTLIVSIIPAGVVPPTSHTGYVSTGTISNYTYPYNTSSSLNGALIDSASHLYAAMNQIKSRANVLTVYEATSDTSRVQDYLNLSKPRIVFATDAGGTPLYPTKYTGPSGPTLSGRTLSYTFTIENATDATPSATRYDLRLYLDLNADGRYKSEEEITDIVVRRADTGTLVSPNSSNVYSLAADVRYVATRQMPSGFAGIIPWKLEVVKNGAPHIHGSEHDYSRIAPAAGRAEKINILQIASSGTGGSANNLNLQTQLEYTSGGNTSNSLYSSVTNRTYKGIYGKLLADVTDFDVTITTKSAATFTGSQTNILNQLNTYDMVIIGFADMYQELSNNAANAVVDFINTGKAVLFTHDTTSLMNVPASYKDNNSARTGSNSTANPGFGDPAHWGYYFNTILRDAVKLDRYGITSGMKTYLKNQTSDTNNGGDKNNTNLTAVQISNLINGNYSVSFTPKSSRTGTQTEAETQGFTNYALVRYAQSGQKLPSKSNFSSGRVTSTVSQVNEGQITTYPYNVNTQYFTSGSGGNYMTVSETHEQYYQLNMNSDDIVVWYCLSNGSGASSANDYYAALPNDVVNAYYIYNCGNVTYSGVGHKIETTAVDEAKLFVNTMIAAYRTVSEAPTVLFTSDSTGNTPADYYFLTAEFMGSGLKDGLLEQNFTDEADPNRQMFFKISDPNLNTQKIITAKLYYVSPTGTQLSWSGDDKVTLISPYLYYADSGSRAETLTGGLVYSFYLPDEVLNLLADKNTNMVKIYIRVETRIGGDTFHGGDSVELRKVGLFTLR